MTKKILGKQSVDYVSKKTNSPVVGVTLHVVGEDSRVEGMACETIYVSEKSPMYQQVLSYPLGSEIMVQYNRWGNVDTIALCKTDNK